MEINNNFNNQPLTTQNQQENYLVQVFCLLDDLCKAICIENSTDKPKGGRSSSLSLSEVMAILMLQKEY